MSTTKRIVYAFVAAVILGIVLLFNLEIVARGVAFLGYPLKLGVQYLFTVPFVYYSFSALFPRSAAASSMSAVTAVSIGAALYIMLAALPAWDWNAVLFKLGAILAGGLITWLFSRAG